MMKSTRSRVIAGCGALLLLSAVGAQVLRPTTANRTVSNQVTACGSQLCLNGSPWVMFGATVYNPGLWPPQSGMENPDGTISLATEAHLNTIRLVNYVHDSGDPDTEFFDETRWRRVDAMIAAASKAGFKIDLDLADYRNLLWEDCVNPYTANWSHAIDYVAHRRNTVTGAIYAADPTLAMVSIAGEPLRTGSHHFTARTTGHDCTISYTTDDLTRFYDRTTSAWAAFQGPVLVNSGGLGYIDFDSGIDWKAIFSLRNNQICSIKTYGQMLDFAPTVAQFCQNAGKPFIDEEFGWKQSDGDDQRARDFAHTATMLHALHFSGWAFWNLGWQVAPTSYEVNPHTSRAFAAVQHASPDYLR